MLYNLVKRFTVLYIILLTELNIFYERYKYPLRSRKFALNARDIEIFIF